MFTTTNSTTSFGIFFGQLRRTPGLVYAVCSLTVYAGSTIVRAAREDVHAVGPLARRIRVPESAWRAWQTRAPQSDVDIHRSRPRSELGRAHMLEDLGEFAWGDCSIGFSTRSRSLASPRMQQDKEHPMRSRKSYSKLLVAPGGFMKRQSFPRESIGTL